MRDTPDGDGTLLDHSLLLYGAGMGDGDTHTPLDLPVVLAGGAQRAAEGRTPRADTRMNTPFMNLCLTHARQGRRVSVDRIGDSTGRLTDL